VPFTCGICGEDHDELMLDIRMGLPDAVFRTPESERGDRADIGEDTGVFVDEDGRVHHYVRGLLELPIPELGRYFGFGAWVEVEAGDYERLAVLWDDPEAAGLEFEGSLANELQPYVGTEGLRVTLRLRSVELLPAIELADADHPVVHEYRGGIDPHRAAELAATVEH
jgi:hypothetical protein